MATLIPASGEAREVHPVDGDTFTLQELQGIVGGYIEALRAPDGRLMFCNEDGKRLGLAFNGTATALMAARIQLTDYIVGDVILCNRRECGEGAP